MGGTYRIRGPTFGAIGGLGGLGGEIWGQRTILGALVGLGGRYEARGPTFGVFGVQIWGERSHVWGLQGTYGVKGAACGELGGLGVRYGVKGTALGALMGSWGEI